MHLVIDGFRAERSRLEDFELIFDILDSYPRQIGMTKIMPPYVFKYHGVRPEDWGVSGFVLIAESHISIHTFPEHRMVNVDMFSCKEFDTDAAIAYVTERLGLGETKVTILERGLEYVAVR